MMCDNPVVVGALIGLALLIGVWVGHVMTFRTAWYFRVYREEREEEP
jgi:hypothetical protein